MDGIAHRVAAFVMGLGYLANLGPPLAVPARDAGLDPTFAAHAFVRVGVGIAHRAGERGAARG